MKAFVKVLLVVGLLLLPSSWAIAASTETVVEVDVHNTLDVPVTLFLTTPESGQTTQEVEAGSSIALSFANFPTGTSETIRDSLTFKKDGKIMGVYVLRVTAILESDGYKVTDFELVWDQVDADCKVAVTTQPYPTSGPTQYKAGVTISQ